MKNTILIASLAILLVGCETNWGPNQTAGTLIGAGGGALIGSRFGGGSGRVAATAIGAAGGAAVGSAIGRRFD
jgi:uncharacterized protein YcfJ